MSTTHLALTIALAGQGVITVKASDGPGALQAAIDAAADGDILWVEPGEYSAIEIVGKGLTLRPQDPAGTIRLLVDAAFGGETLRIADLPLGSVVAASGLEVTNALSDYSVLVTDCVGPVLLRDVSLTPPDPASGSEPRFHLARAVDSSLLWIEDSTVDAVSSPSWTANKSLIRAENSGLLIADCTLHSPDAPLGTGIDGQTVIFALSSDVTVANSSLRPGTGASEFNPPIEPLPACSGTSLSMFGSSGRWIGGPDNLALGGDYVPEEPGGYYVTTCNATSAVQVFSGSTFEYAADARFIPGRQGAGPAAPPVLVTAGTTGIELPSELTSVRFESDFAAPGGTLRVQFFGTPGNVEFPAVQAGLAGPAFTLPNVSGPLLLDPASAQLLPPVPLAAAPPGLPGGELTGTLPSSFALLGQHLTCQSLHLDSNGSLQTSTPTTSLVVP